MGEDTATNKQAVTDGQPQASTAAEQPDTVNATGQGGDTQQNGGDRQFTQADIDRIVAERIARERNKAAEQYADYDTLKQQAAQWAEYQEAQKSEQEKLADKIAQLEQEREAAKAAAEQSAQAAQDTLKRAAVIAVAGQRRARNPEDAYRLIDATALTIDEHGVVQGAQDAVTALIESGRLPTMDKPNAPNMDAGAGTGQRQNVKPEDEDYIAMMRSLGYKIGADGKVTK